MKEKILALLKTKFPGVDEATLIRIAEKKAAGVTDESQVQPIADGVGFQDVLNSYGDFRANGAVASAVSNYEKKHNIKDGKPIENPNPIPNPKPEDKKDDVPAWAQALIDSNKNLLTELSALKQEKLQATRQEQIMAKAKEYGIPETFAKRYAIPDDADLDTYFKDAKQELANIGFSGVNPPESAETKIEKENESIAGMISEGTKTIVESKK
ncbi:hypothetical protein [uncultured Parabacteroides sp.]|jgi:hypothetical protein|uniref:hypothetical protein n=1 Tax=uncultured Parabacteroides sp. TaxID=512312 RepID=UPI0028042104|nr:hypothetical protein [uncultured Parabacteroides sp.]